MLQNRFSLMAVFLAAASGISAGGGGGTRATATGAAGASPAGSGREDSTNPRAVSAADLEDDEDGYDQHLRRALVPEVSKEAPQPIESRRANAALTPEQKRGLKPGEGKTREQQVHERAAASQKKGARGTKGDE